MTEQEFNEYLISIGGLNRTYREYKGPIVDCKSLGVGSGWYGLLKDLIVELIAAGWDKRLHQSKEKFGSLRFYIENSSPELTAIISKYEAKSSTICEKCGAEGKQRVGGWISTLCDQHAEGRETLEIHFKNLQNKK